MTGKHIRKLAGHNISSNVQKLSCAWLKSLKSAADETRRLNMSMMPTAYCLLPTTWGPTAPSLLLPPAAATTATSCCHYCHSSAFPHACA